MTIYTIYRFTNLINGKIYIGKSIEPERRRVNHLTSANSGSTTAFHRAIRKYGIDEFSFEIIDDSATNNHEHNILERYFIERNNSCTVDIGHNGYNMTRGGDGVDSESGTKIQKERYAAGTHNWCSIDLSARNTKNNLKKVADGTHHFLGSDFNDARVANGTHPWAGEAGRIHNSKKANDAIAAGTHNFGSAFSTEHNVARVDAGTHNWQSDKSKQRSVEQSKNWLAAGIHPLQLVQKCLVGCLYCKKEFTKPNFTRWHGDKCKFKPK